MFNQKSVYLKKENKDVCPVMSFYACLENVKKSIGFDYICNADKPLAHECCLAICEVLCRRCGVIRIDGEEMPADMVAEIFEHLTYEHLQYVCDRYKLITSEIRRKKQYLRAALYNAYFELEAAVINDVARDNG